MTLKKIKESAPESPLPHQDYQKIIHDWNNTFCHYSSNKKVHQFFEEQARKTPESVALIFENYRLSYAELNHASDQLACLIKKRLKKQAHSQQPLITIALERSLEMVIGILGILKAGAAYVPIDPHYPIERIRYIINDTQSSLLLTQSSFISQLKPQLDVEFIVLDEKPYCNEQPELSSVAIREAVDLQPQACLAYVIYTSGTTGQPKGVAITHAGLVNRLEWMQRCYPLDSNDVVLQKTPFSFDVSVWELLWAHQHGARLVMAKPNGHQDPDYIYRLMHQENISVVHFVPSMLSTFTRTLNALNQSIPSCLRYVFCSGEELTIQQVKNFYGLSDHALELHNLYGPTEASIDVTAFFCSREHDKVFIGKPIQNMQTYVLDEQLNPVAVGIAGELYLGGVGLAAGYLNQKELTAERFISNPFTQGERLYKTGDLVRWQPDGNLEYLGRNDFQVKIRGLRIELGEIESTLVTYPGIHQTVVVVQTQEKHNGTESHLVAYYVAETAIDDNQLITHLKQRIPSHMIPNAFVRMNEFPLNANGKLDRKALPTHHFIVDMAENDTLAEPNSLEQQLIAIWSDELSLPTVGLTQRFYNLGGHSLIAARIVSKINHQLGKSTSLSEFYAAETIANLTLVLDNNTHDRSQEPIDNLTLSVNKLPLNDFQLMLWLSDLFEPKAKKMNIVDRKRLHGVLDINLLRRAFEKTLTTHEALSYHISKFYPAQRMKKTVSLLIDETDYTKLSTTDCEHALSQSFNELINMYPWPKQAPQVLARLFSLPNNCVELQLCMPHLISDEFSMQILNADLSANYLHVLDASNALDTAHEHPIIPFKDYILEEQNTNNANIKAKLSFWQNYLSDARLFILPEHAIVKNMQQRQLSYSSYIEIPENAIVNLKRFCAHNHVNVNDTLSAILAKTLSQHCDQLHEQSKPVLINLIKSTRENSKYDHTIGCFVRVDPIKIRLSDKTHLNHLAQQVHHSMIDTAPQQACSSLLKFAFLTGCFKKRRMLRACLTRIGMPIYTQILRLLKINYKSYKAFNLSWRLAEFDRKNPFIVNLNLWNNFLSDATRGHETLFNLKLSHIPLTQYELSTIDYIFDVCFLRDDTPKKTSYLVISSNLEPSFRQTIAEGIIHCMQHECAE